MIKNKSLLSVTLLSLTLVACNGGGGGGGSSAAPEEAHTPLAYKIVQVDQDGFSDTFRANDKIILDLRPLNKWSYYYVYFTNNQTFPLVNGVSVTNTDPTNGSGSQSWTNVIAQPNDPLDCKNTKPLAVGAQCRALVRSVNAAASLPPSQQVESFNTLLNYGYCWADAQVSDGYACNSSGGGMLFWPSISIPSTAGVWTQASNGDSGTPQGLTLDGSFLFAASGLGTSSKYSITYNQQNGTAWVNLESPVQVFGYVGNNLNKMFTYALQPIGQSDGVLWAQNAGGMFYDQAVYQYGANLYYSVPTWLELDDVSISKYNKFTNGLDGGLYLTGGSNTNYRFNGTSFIALNMPLCTKPGPLGCNMTVQAVAVDGTIVKSEGCFKTTDGINYTLTPFSGAVESAPFFTMWNDKVWAWDDANNGREVDTDKCIINPYPKMIAASSLPQQGSLNSTTNGYFMASGNMYFYPPDSYWK
mgnify:CR=1 FL=1